MRISPPIFTRAKTVVIWLGIFLAAPAFAQSNLNVRVMAANLNGNTQSYQPFALRILQGTKADVVAIQEFNYNNNAGSDFRSLVDTCFGTDFVYYREPFNASGNIPNGIISRWPIVAAGSWADTVQSQPNRGFAWAQIQLPGTNSLYIVSVHLLTSSAANRSAEATNLKALVQANFPSGAFIVVAGDFNTASRTESTTMSTFTSYLNDFPVPVDNNGNSFTSVNRNYPHDYVLPNSALTNFETATVFSSHSFPNGLVFDSAVYTPLTDVSPVQSADSGQAQHMAVMKDFKITLPAANIVVPPPVLVLASANVLRWTGVSNLTYSVQAKTSLTVSNWTKVGAVSSPTANFAFTNSLSLTNQMFFRISYP